MTRPGPTIARRTRRPAMSDVAALAGVSHQTVSRVLNEHPSVAPATRDRVLAAIAQVGYRRNNAARSLVTRATGAVGVLTPATTLYGPTSALVAIEAAARDRGYLVDVAMLRRFDTAAVRASLDQLLEQDVDGLLLVAPTAEVVDALGELPAGLPTVVVTAAALGERPPHLHQVAADQLGGARVATAHLLAAGRREVVHVSGPQDWFDARDRLLGWQQACAQAGVAPGRLLLAGWSAADGAAVGRRLVAEGLPDAVFAGDDQIAFGLLNAFWAAGVRVPDDVAVVGYDDEPAAAFTVPPLTTVRQDLAAVGTAAVDALFAQETGEPVVIPAALVLRTSA